VTSGRHEWKAGKQDLHLDEANQVLWIRVNEAMNVEEYREIIRITEEVFHDRQSRCIWDLQGKMHSLSRDVRRAMKEQMKADRDRGLAQTGKSAILGANYGVRVLAMIMLRLLGGVEQTCFCRTEAEALAFLSE
jgi:hypothetical protein